MWPHDETTTTITAKSAWLAFLHVQQCGNTWPVGNPIGKVPRLAGTFLFPAMRNAKSEKHAESHSSRAAAEAATAAESRAEHSVNGSLRFRSEFNCMLI